MSEHKCVSHYQKEDSQSQVTEGELPSMVSCLYCICCVRIHTDLQELKVYVGGRGTCRVSERRTVIQPVFNFLVELPVIASLYLDPQAFQCCGLLLFRLMALGKLSKHLDQNRCHAH